MPKQLLTSLILLITITAHGQEKDSLLISLPDTLLKAKPVSMPYRQLQPDVHGTIPTPVYVESLEPFIINRNYHISKELIDTPASISVLSQKDLQRNNSADISPVLNTLPGVYMQSGALNTNRISIRGIGARTPYGTNKIRAFYGSIPLTSGDSETTIEDIDLQILDNVEVIKGPLSSLYGAGLGGAILLTPRKGFSIYDKDSYPLQSQARSNTTIGSFGLQKNTFMYNLNSSTGSLNLSYHNLQSDGWRQNSAYNREGVTLSGDVRVTKKSALTYFGNHTYMKAYVPSSVSLSSFNSNPRAAAPTWAASKGFERYTSYMAGVGYEHEITSAISNATSVFISGKQNYEPRPFDILTQNNTAWGARTQFKANLHKLDLITGFEYFNDGFTGGTFENLYQDNNGNGTLQGNRLTGNRERRRFINAFAQARMQFSPIWEMQAGVNYNKTRFELDNTYPIAGASSQSYSYDGIWAPQVSILFKPGYLNTVYASASRGFSMPAIEETLTPQGTINPDIKPESGYSLEVGYKAYWLNRQLYTEVSAYSMQVNNLLVAQRVGDDQYVGVNAGKTLHQGIEILLKARTDLAVGWYIEPYVAASIGKYEFKEFVNNDTDYSGNNLTGVPKDKVNAGISLNMPFGLYLSSDYYYVSQIPLDDANSGYADSYNLLNAKAGWSKSIAVHNKEQAISINVSAGINNITNTHYASMVLVNATGINGAQPRYYYPGLPVNYYGSIGVSYGF